MADRPAHSTVVGIFGERRRAEEALAALRAAGFSQDDLSFIIRRGPANIVDALPLETGTRGEEDAAAGAIAGSAMGGLLAAAAVGALPGIGPVIAGGAAAAIIGAEAAGGLAGGLVGWLTGSGVPEEHARYYDRALPRAAALVVVHAAGRAEEARRILRQARASEVEIAPDPPSSRQGSASHT